jgi:hypothetical protein
MNGQKLCFAAYKLDGTQEGATAVYTYSTVTNKWTPDGNPLGVVPDNSTTYRFVAYSNFGETTTPGTSIDLTKDLVWGSAEKKIEDTETSRTVTINMLHKFARVKVRVKSGISGVNITALSGVEIEGGNWTTFDPFDGSFGTVGSMTQGVSFTGSFPTAQLESTQRLVFPVSPAPTKVKVGTVKVSAVGTTFSNSTVEFNSVLSGGTSYVLVVDVKKCVWSRSNVYWDGSKMTFVPAGNDLSKQGYQGLIFKWGSLVGVSATGGAPFTVYPANATPYTTSSWIAIPYEDDLDVTTVGAPNTTTLKGDICKYINSGYRLPKNSEFGTGSGWGQQGWEYYVNSAASGAVAYENTDGAYDFVANGGGCAKNTVMGDVIFPASGTRDYHGALEYGNVFGVYWSNSANNTAKPLIFSAQHSVVLPSGSERRDAGSRVRCVQN